MIYKCTVCVSVRRGDGSPPEGLTDVPITPLCAARSLYIPTQRSVCVCAGTSASTGDTECVECVRRDTRSHW